MVLRAFANRFARWSPVLVVVLAIVGLSVSLFILFFWPDAGSTLADRASVSSAVATGFALGAAIVAVSAGVWVTTSDYRAAENVKKDTARIRATLQSIRYKADLFSGTPGLETFKPERDAINDFLLTTTAFGYRKWVEEGDLEGAEAPRWRSIFETFTYLLDACEPPAERTKISLRARELEELLSKQKTSDVRKISAYAADLAGLLGNTVALIAPDDIARQLTSRDVVAPVAAAAETESEGETRRKFQHLRDKAVVDPNVDMFVAVFENNVDALKAALDAGADTSLTDRQVLAAHRVELADFDPVPLRRLSS